MLCGSRQRNVERRYLEVVDELAEDFMSHPDLWTAPTARSTLHCCQNGYGGKHTGRVKGCREPLLPSPHPLFSALHTGVFSSLLSICFVPFSASFSMVLSLANLFLVAVGETVILLALPHRLY